MSIIITLSIFWMICCVYGGNNSIPSPEQRNCTATISAILPDPSSGCCGITSEVENKLYDGLQARIKQHPWLALIEYLRKNQKVKTVCNGVLISSRYVLTAGQCVVGTVLNYGELLNIRLGEYNIHNEGKDCVIIETGEEVCTDGAIRIPIEKVIPHPELNLTRAVTKNDIALIKMTEMAPFTDFIRPICLPTSDITLKLEPIILQQASWAPPASFIQKTPLSTKSQLTIPFITEDDCRLLYRREDLYLIDQFCAGGRGTDTFCKGDGGAPLIYNNNKIYEAIGIVTRGPNPCSSSTPTIYTKIYSYNSWIRSNIET